MIPWLEKSVIITNHCPNEKVSLCEQAVANVGKLGLNFGRS